MPGRAVGTDHVGPPSPRAVEFPQPRNVGDADNMILHLQYILLLENAQDADNGTVGHAQGSSDFSRRQKQLDEPGAHVAVGLRLGGHREHNEQAENAGSLAEEPLFGQVLFGGSQVACQPLRELQRGC